MNDKYITSIRNTEWRRYASCCMRGEQRCSSNNGYIVSRILNAQHEVCFYRGPLPICGLPHNARCPLVLKDIAVIGIEPVCDVCHAHANNKVQLNITLQCDFSDCHGSEIHGKAKIYIYADNCCNGIPQCMIYRSAVIDIVHANMQCCCETNAALRIHLYTILCESGAIAGNAHHCFPLRWMPLYPVPAAAKQNVYTSECMHYSSKSAEKNEKM